MSPQGSKHSLTVTLINRVFLSVFGPEFFVRAQLPLALGKRLELEPDFAVIRGDPRHFADEHPSTANLVVEVAESSLAYDRTTKASLYAKAGVPEYWVVDLVHRQIEVRREPKAISGEKRKFAYGETRLFTEDEAVRPLIAPEAKIAVRDLLP